MRGLPGCGKSRYIKTAGFPNPDRMVVVSADNYHCVTDPDGGTRYDFKPENVKRAHDQCYRDFIGAVDNGDWATIIVDNTNLSSWEIAPYYRYAEVMGLDVEIVRLRVPVEKCIARGTHNVPRETYAKMADRLEKEVLPPWWKQTVYHGDENGALIKSER